MNIVTVVQEHEINLDTVLGTFSHWTSIFLKSIIEILIFVPGIEHLAFLDTLFTYKAASILSMCTWNVSLNHRLSHWPNHNKLQLQFHGFSSNKTPPKICNKETVKTQWFILKEILINIIEISLLYQQRKKSRYLW